MLRTDHFNSADDLETTLRRYVWLYNEHLPQKQGYRMKKSSEMWYRRERKRFLIAHNSCSI